MVIASDYALAPLVNVKLVDTLVFVAAFVFGLRIGTSVAVMSELIWGIFSPYGFGGYIIPFLVVGEILYAIAGFLASKIWGDKISGMSEENLFFGALIAVCAFIWDLETNIATGVLATWPHLSGYTLTFVFSGIPFIVPHEVSDFAIGSTLAPIAIALLLKRRKERPELMTKPIP